jgi:hypothetical protein
MTYARFYLDRLTKTTKFHNHDCVYDAGFFMSLFFPLLYFVPLNPSLLLHVTCVPRYCPHTRNRTQTSMPPAGFEPTIPASERPQTHALDHATTGIGLGFEPSVSRMQVRSGTAQANLQVTVTVCILAFIPDMAY